MEKANLREITGEELVQKIAESSAKKGGRAFLVGGYVRDYLLGRPGKDLDVEIHGLTPEQVEEVLTEVTGGKAGGAEAPCGEAGGSAMLRESIGSSAMPCGFIKKGKAFGVYGIPHLDLDIALPRSETATGRGHKDFDILIEPFIGPAKAARRRDFTVNAMMMDPLSGEILDFYGGKEDLKNKILRHVDDDAFGEDPLRVLRAAQFAARFEFDIAPETVAICKTIDLTALSRERVFEELSKALLKANRPSIFFEKLREMGQLKDWFSEVEALIGVEQSPIFHPEGDVYVHTMRVLDAAADVIQSSWEPRTENPEIPKDIAACDKYRPDAKASENNQQEENSCSKYRPEARNLYFMLSALCHDMGKPATTAFVGGRIRALGHEEEGEKVSRKFLERLTSERDLIKYVTNMVLLHMKPNMLCGQNSGIKATNRLFDKSCDPAGLVMIARCDRRREPEDIEKIMAMAEELEARMDTSAGDYKETRPENESPAQREQRFEDFLWLRLKAYKEQMAKPQVTGEDLIAAGIEPGPEFSELLEFAHRLHLAGVPKSDALKQVLAQAGA